MVGMVSCLKKIINTLDHLEDGVLFVLFLTLVGLAFGQVILRNFFDSSIVWADVAIRVLVLWVTVFGAMVATRRHEHIRIDLVPEMLKGRPRHIVRALYLLTASTVAFAVSYYSLEVVRLEMQYPSTAFADIPTWMTQVVIPFGFGVIGLRFLGQGIYALREMQP